MNPAEQALVSYLAEVKPVKTGFIELRTNVAGWCADLDLNARYNLFTSECVFDDCTDQQATTFLTAFLASGLAVSWSVSEQLSKLLAVRGHLVSESIEPLLATKDWSSCGGHQLFLS